MVLPLFCTGRFVNRYARQLQGMSLDRAHQSTSLLFSTQRERFTVTSRENTGRNCTEIAPNTSPRLPTFNKCKWRLVSSTSLTRTVLFLHQLLAPQFLPQQHIYGLYQRLCTRSQFFVQYVRVWAIIAARPRNKMGSHDLWCWLWTISLRKIMMELGKQPNSLSKSVSKRNHTQPLELNTQLLLVKVQTQLNTGTSKCENFSLLQTNCSVCSTKTSLFKLSLFHVIVLS